eukprot:2959181-Prymnesium_polylepis.1
MGGAGGRAESSERWRAGLGSPAGAGWGHMQAGARRGSCREQHRFCVESMFARPPSQALEMKVFY